MKLERRRVSGEYRIEITGQNLWYIARNFSDIIAERINYNYRYFIPTGEKGKAIISKIMELNPVLEVRKKLISPDDEDDAKISTDPTKQDIKSNETSINASRLPAVFSKVRFQPYTVNLDIGGGKFDNVTDFLASQNVKNFIYDPYNRSPEHNAMAAAATEEGQSDTVTISNVLNVIREQSARNEVLANAVDAVKPDGTVYITVYEGDGSGVGKETSKGWQENRLTSSYIPEIRKYFSDLTIKDKVIYARGPKKDKLGNTDGLTGYGMPMLPAATGKNTSGEAKRASEIVSDFADKLNAFIRKDRVSAGRIGEFNRKTHMIRIKKANDIPTLSHETGHFLDKLFNLSGTADRVTNKQLEALGAATSRKSYSPARKRREGVAEFLRRYLTGDEETLRTEFALAYEHITGKLPDNIMKAINELKDDIWNLTNLTPSARVRSSVVLPGDKVRKGPGIDIRSTFRKVYAGLVDTTYPVEWAAGKLSGPEAQEHIKHELSAMRGYEGAALFSLNPDGKPGHYQINLKGERVGESYYDILKAVNGSEEMLSDFAVYNVARRAEDYFNRGLELPDSQETYEATVAEMERKYPQFKETFEKLVKFRANNLHLLVEGGIISEDKYHEILAANPNYAPLQRILGTYRKETMGRVSLRTGSSRAIGGSKKVIHELRGGGEDIINPIESDINNIFLYLSAAQRNYILIELAEMADKAEGAGNIMARAKTKYKMTSFNLSQLKGEIEKALGVLTNNDFDVHARVFQPNYMAGTDQVVIYMDGEPVLYDLDHELYLALTDVSPRSGNIILRVAIAASTLQRSGILFTPRYIYRNLARDTLQNLIASESGLNPINILDGLISMLQKDEWYRLVQRSGGTTNFFTVNDRRFAQESIEDILSGRSKAARYWNKIKHPLRTMQDAIEIGEMAGRLGDVKRALKELGINPEEMELDRETVKKVIYQMRDLSVDFKRMGRWVRKYNANRIINFLNSNLQGMDKLARMFSTKEKAWRTVFRSLLYITLPTLLLAWMCRDNENYNDLPWYRKDFFWNVPLGNPETATFFLPIPRPWELGVIFGAIPERLFDMAYHRNPTAFDGLGETFTQLLPDMMPALLEPLYRDATGKKWTGIPILNSKDETLSATHPELQYNQYTSEVSKVIAGFAVNLPLVPEWMKSPKRLDQIITGYSGTIGSITLTSIDQLAGTKEGIPFFSGLSQGFVLDATENPRSIDDYYTYKSILESDYAAYLVTGEHPDDYAPWLLEVFRKVDSEITKVRKAEKEIEKEPASIEREEALLEIRMREIQLMRAANAIYEKERFEK